MRILIRPRISFRVLLVIVMIAGLGLAWISNRAASQKASVSWVIQNGGTVEYDFETNDTGMLPVGWPEHVDQRSWMVKKLHSLIGVDYFANVESVSLSHTDVRSLDKISTLKHLKYLDLDKTQVSDLNQLNAFSELICLSLTKTQVDDLAPLKKLRQLEFLWISQTRITTIVDLSECSRLQVIGLNDTQITEIKAAYQLPNLQHLICNNTKIDLDKLREFQRKRPSCYVWSNGLHREKRASRKTVRLLGSSEKVPKN